MTIDRAREIVDAVAEGRLALADSDGAPATIHDHDIAQATCVCIKALWKDVEPHEIARAVRHLLERQGGQSC